MHKLIAVLLSDGTVDPNRYTVSFTENENLVARLVSELNHVDGLELAWKTDKHHDSLRARAYSKELVTELYKTFNTFRRRPCNQNPVCRNKATCRTCEPLNGYPTIRIPKTFLTSVNQKTEFLKYYASCDGSVTLSVYRRSDNNYLEIDSDVKIGSTNPEIKALITRSLTELGFTHILQKETGVVLKEYKNIERFQKEIGFLDEAVVRRGYFNGLSKNALLSIAVKSKYQSRREYWANRLKDKREILEKILSLRE